MHLPTLDALHFGNGVAKPDKYQLAVFFSMNADVMILALKRDDGADKS